MLNLKVGGLTGGSGEGEEKQGSPGDHHHHHLGTIKITITIIKGIATITTSTTTHTKVRSRKYTHYSIYCQICHKILQTCLFYIRFGVFSSPFRLSKWLSTFPDIMCHNFASCSEEIPSISVLSISSQPSFVIETKLLCNLSMSREQEVFRQLRSKLYCLVLNL